MQLTSTTSLHLVRYLDDFHEPTLSARRRTALRALPRATDALARRAALHAVARSFLAAPVRWRDIVTAAAYQQAVRAVEQALGTRLKVPGRTPDQFAHKLEVGLAMLLDAGATTSADHIRHAFAAQQAQLDAAAVTLVYQEQQYLQLLGIQGGRRVRRHLARGLHLIVSDQQHRRQDRIVDTWRDTSQPDQFIPPM